MFGRSAAAAVVESGAWADSEPAVALFHTLSEPRQASTARRLASNWARRDMPAARAWATALPSGRTRDAALMGVVEGSDASPDPALLLLFQSETLRQEVIVDAVPRVGRRDPVEGRRLMDAHLTDPALRQQAEHLLQNID